ncbi:MAG: hypothetical protein JJ964_10405 [Rhizobiales bacterium]|nr:hypothetical protein [Hyphomicrobiales bacterium]
MSINDDHRDEVLKSFIEACDWYDDHADLSERERIEKMHDTKRIDDLEYQEFVGMTMWRNFTGDVGEA